ncbi:hypothetical protein BD309DRAFT_885443 [Dichomitus squalens]|uniref:Uncharacterized protein n=2 Tax=Dichomitus squalens TaxID=114155 RepID=A0A4Q9QFR7_9APHY|nr:hypothetical protein BD309DRAFT_885443 [Dichomitus squalens]TBU66081.1 hypothetical protein BD310DRAFT_865456 [Dichomitus squalens]
MPSAPQQSWPPSLFYMARSKLNTAVSGVSKDSSSLHRWVLLKNSILRSHTVDPAPPTADADVQHVYRPDDEAHDEVEEDAFMFPDPHALGSRSAGGGDSEKQWLDSLLEDLGDDDDYADVDGPAASSSSLPVDEDDEQLSPLCSPSSSSDDLVGQHSSLFYQPPPIAVPYPVPYPPLHSPLSPSWLQLDSCDHDPLPYFDVDDDVEDLCMPDAIEDTSDDESDALSTPYSRSMSSLSPTDPASVPLPAERTRLRGHPHVYVESDSDYFYPFELDPPLPFHDEDHSDSDRVFRSPIYQEC